MTNTRSPSVRVLSSATPCTPSRPCKLRPLASTTYISSPSPTYIIHMHTDKGGSRTYIHVSDIPTQNIARNRHAKRLEKRTSIWRSVALVNESMTMERTSESGRCVGCGVPGAGVWFLKYIYESEENEEMSIPMCRTGWADVSRVSVGHN